MCIPANSLLLGSTLVVMSHVWGPLFARCRHHEVSGAKVKVGLATQCSPICPGRQHVMIIETEAQELVEKLRDPATCTPWVVDRYYTLCIPFYREFLGNHWHTGYYHDDNQPIGPQDQLRMEERIAESADVVPESHVLDVGCGIGGPTCHLASVTGARLRGLTPNAAQLELARKLAHDAKVANQVTFDQGNASSLPYPDNFFDIVLFFESPCHFPDRNKFFREVWRVLHPGGRLAGEDWLKMDGLRHEDHGRYIGPICETWAIPELGTLTSYTAAMVQAGLVVEEAVDLRDEMALLRGFLVERTEREKVFAEKERTADPIRKVIMEGILHLGEAAAAGVFTLGRFLAVKE